MTEETETTEIESPFMTQFKAAVDARLATMTPEEVRAMWERAGVEFEDEALESDLKFVAHADERDIEQLKQAINNTGK